ncbi:39S ribosomal protein L21, mitochondrial-like [Penaeus japonicus]|uniref:39S ribosomal protein L21, mitochondrial-like n=1 Tax=Penaeus japonicus TaxID=27405 RepID=UPI001C70CE19|nr:39S ribosomal protein L21, mitochondrial-like [Penaeus japonicus]
MSAAALLRSLRPTQRAASALLGNKKIISHAVGRAPLLSAVSGLRTPSFTTPVVQQSVKQEFAKDSKQEQDLFSESVINKVNEQIIKKSHGRLFAVVYVHGHQHLVTPEDLVVVQGVFPPSIGDVIRLEKVLCVGGQDFTLFGRPLLQKDLVNVEATVVEKTLSHCRVYFYNRRRKNSRKTKFNRETHTLLRINRVEIMQKIDEVPEVEGVDGRIF